MVETCCLVIALKLEGTRNKTGHALIHGEWAGGCLLRLHMLEDADVLTIKTQYAASELKLWKTMYQNANGDG